MKKTLWFRLGLVVLAVIAVVAGCTAAASEPRSVRTTPSTMMDDVKQVDRVLGYEIAGDSEDVQITIAYMTPIEWADLNAQADRDTYATVQAEGKLPSETLDQIPEPVGITPVLPRESDHKLLVVDIRGILFAPKVGWGKPSTFDNIQLVYDLKSGTRVDGSAQSSESAFRLEGKRITVDELESLVASLKPMETPVIDELDMQILSVTRTPYSILLPSEK